jgi:hypothetical protein
MPIQSAVGLGAANLAGDVLFVQILLAGWHALEGIPPLAIDGDIGPEMIDSIKKFQREQQTGGAEGRIDPGDAALARLEELHLRGVRAAAVNPAPASLLPPGVPQPVLPGPVVDEICRRYLDTLRKNLD